MLFAAAFVLTSPLSTAQQPSAPPPPAAPPPARPPDPLPARKVTEPDEDLLDFLGSDDTGDVAWWEFLKRAPPRVNPPEQPPQDAK